MWIPQYSITMNSNQLYSRLLCSMRVRYFNTSNTVFNNHGKYVLSQLGSKFWDPSKGIHISTPTYNEESVEETGDSEELSPTLPRTLIMEDYSEQFRNTLYPDSDDKLISHFKSCDSIKDLLAALNENKQSLSSAHYCQILLVLYDILQTKMSVVNGRTPGLCYLPKVIENELPQPIYEIVLNILNSLKDDVEELTPEELVCCLLFSKRLGIDIQHPAAQHILMKINYLLSNQDPESFSITALSRFTITFNYQGDIRNKMFLIKTLPLIYKHFDICRNAEEFRALTICMLSTAPFLREELFFAYEALTEEFVSKGLITRDNHSVIVKAVMLLNNVYENPNARFMIYKLLGMLRGQLDKMFIPHLYEILKVVMLQVEPHDTVVEINNVKKNHLVTPLDNALLYYHLPLMRLPQDGKDSQVMKDLITRSDNLEGLLSGHVLLTTAMPDVCRLFWSKVADLMQSVAPGDLPTLWRICLRYLSFSHRMVSYRHPKFESVALSLVARELVEGATVMQPKWFALLASFVLSVDSGQGAASLSNDIIARLLTVMGQLDVQSCLWVSRSLSTRLRRSRDVHALLQVDTAMNERIRELMNTVDPTSIKTFNIILRSCINRRQSMESDLMRDLINRWHLLDWSGLTSRTLRNLVYNLHITNALIPTVVDRMVEYCLDNSGQVVVATLGKLLHMCYHLGYTPPHVDSLCGLTADLAIRDCDMLNGLSLLQVALALSFFNSLPHSFIRVIFTVDFLEKLDNEIKHCFAKDSYPMRVRHTLMKLNRSVCLDQPEADVPWFHSKFCEEQKALGQMDVASKSLLLMDVHSTLLKLVGDTKYIGTKTYTPYGYTLDMQLNLDASLNPVQIKDTENVAHKLAILLHHADCYTVVEPRLKGYHQMKRRHLEILGYRVISLSDTLWNSMFMMEPKAKLEYLKNLIWPS